ncbi:Wzz/FepE/Etk N-terminal domain-containing protein [uncultured Merdimonas sp.]|uniref:YveK family protein n=1 Tax=uncultured Merdimonas sp. TaxID=2023269 RepID=UPI00320B679F
MNQERLMTQEMDNDEITIDLTELFIALWSKLHIILMAGVLGALIAFVGTNLLITPMYTSETKVYVLSRSDSNAGVTYNDLQTGTQLTQDYMELVTSRPVLEQVIAVLNLDMEPEDLQDMISVETPEGTRILNISVESEDPKEAKEIADAVRDSVSIQITEIMDADAVNTVEEGNLPSTPSSPSLPRNIAIGALLGLVLAMGVIVLIFVLDDTIKTPDDVEHYLGLNTLTSIPLSEGVKKGKKVKRIPEKQMMRNLKR